MTQRGRSISGPWPMCQDTDRSCERGRIVAALRRAEAQRDRYREALDRIAEALRAEEWGDDFEAVVSAAVQNGLASEQEGEA